MEALSASPGKTPREKLLDLEAEINERVFEREEAVRGFIVGLLSRSHVFFLGKKGAAKSLMGRLLCHAIIWDDIPDGFDPFFVQSLARDSSTDEILGPVSAKGYQEDTYRRNTAHMVPESKIALLEEAYKSNPTVLNRLLTIMAEGRFRNGSSPEQKVPLKLLAASSNELPDEADDSLEAFHDRLMLRYEIGYLKDPKNVRRMMEMANRPETEPEPPTTTLTEAEVLEAIDEAARVDVSPVFDKIDEILHETAQRNIETSDRRRANLVRLVKAQAYLAGRSEAKRADLSVLTAALWERQEEITDVRRIVQKAAHPKAAAARALFDAVQDSYEEALRVGRRAKGTGDKDDSEAATTAGVDVTEALYNTRRRLFELHQQAEEDGADESARIVQGLVDKIQPMIDEVDEICL